MKIAAIQMVSATGLQDNLDAARDLLVEAAAQGAELAALPEYFCHMGRRDGDKLGLREDFGTGPIQDWLAETARALGLWIVGGTLPLRADDDQHVRNTSLVYAPDGSCRTRYDKIHLFRFDNGSERYDESRVIESGTAAQSLVLDARDGTRWTLGLSVCYDLRFPELFRRLAADVLLVPSAFTYSTGQAHWELLLRARAVENLAYVVAPAQGGLHENGRRTWGHTMIVDPWGEVVAQREAPGPGVVLAQLDMDRLRALRQQLPALEHRVL